MKHFHLWTRSLDGSEFYNCVYDLDSKNTAVYDYTMMVNKVYQNIGIISVEDVNNSLDRGNGMWMGTKGLMFVLSACELRCESPVWN